VQLPPVSVERHEAAKAAGQAVATVEGFAPRYCQQPGLEAGVAAEAIELPERRDERLLHYLVCLLLRAECRHGRTTRSPLMAVHQVSERPGVACAGFIDQLGVGHTSCRHGVMPESLEIFHVSGNFSPWRSAAVEGRLEPAQLWTN
jgi:hypothetical protein